MWNSLNFFASSKINKKIWRNQRCVADDVKDDALQWLVNLNIGLRPDADLQLRWLVNLNIGLRPDADLQLRWLANLNIGLRPDADAADAAVIG